MISLPTSRTVRRNSGTRFSSPFARLMAAGVLLFSTNAAHALQTGIQYEISATEYQALIDLYESTGGSQWSNDQNWGNPDEVWQNVTIEGVVRDGSGDVTTKGSVTQLTLSNSNLRGTLPESLGNLTKLRTLTLGSNHLKGGIPVSFGGLTQLNMLDLSGNELSGSIPPGLGNLANLKYLLLNDNKLTGRIPGQLGKLAKLQSLNLFNNKIGGTIPASLGGLTRIQDINFGINQLEGVIPSSFTGLKHLTSFELLGNFFNDRDPKSAFFKSRQPLVDKSVAVAYLPQLHRIIELSGDLSFGSVKVNSTGKKNLTIKNTGDYVMKVTRLKLPAGFKGNFTGNIQPGKSKTVVITFAPLAKKTYSGKVSVVSDAGYGVSTRNLSGTGK